MTYHVDRGKLEHNLYIAVTSQKRDTNHKEKSMVINYLGELDN